MQDWRPRYCSSTHEGTDPRGLEAERAADAEEEAMEGNDNEKREGLGDRIRRRRSSSKLYLFLVPEFTDLFF